LRAWSLAAAVVVVTTWLSFGWLESVIAARFQVAAERLVLIRPKLEKFEKVFKDKLRTPAPE
jgi:hypothetical protein